MFNETLLAPPIKAPEPFFFSAQLRDHNNEILSGIAYELSLDDKDYIGTTNAEGFIEHELEKKPGQLILSYRPVPANPDYIESWQGTIDTLESESDTKGQQKRLQQQGYYPGHLDGLDLGKTSSSWAKFTHHQEQNARDGQRLNNPEQSKNSSNKKSD